MDELYKKQEFQQFAEWLATPDDIRVEKTQEEFGIKVGVDPATLSVWKRKDELWDLVKEYNKKMFGKDRTLKLLNAWYVKILANPKAADMELWLQYYDDFSKKTDLNINTDVIDAKKKLEDLLNSNYQKENNDDNQSGIEQTVDEDPISG